MIEAVKDSLAENGYAICSSFLSDETIEGYRAILGAADSSQVSPGRRDLLSQFPDIRDLAHSESLLKLVVAAIGSGSFPVRAIFFDKREHANWPVLWHQDLSIAVRQRVECEGYEPWSVKGGIPHVQPPARVLESMVTLRIHLDDAGENNGALWVVPGSHKLGKVPEKNISDHVNRKRIEICTVRAGDVMLMKPLLLHSSRRAVKPTHRRVIHLEYASCELPERLEWYERNK